MFFSINSQYSKLCFKGFHGGIIIFPLEFFYNQDRNNQKKSYIPQRWTTLSDGSLRAKAHCMIPNRIQNQIQKQYQNWDHDTSQDYVQGLYKREGRQQTFYFSYHIFAMRITLAYPLPPQSAFHQKVNGIICAVGTSLYLLEPNFDR